MVADPPDAELERLLEYLKESRGFDFSAYKRGTLSRRLARRMAQIEVATYADYIDYLEVHPDEFQQLFDTILINVTSFFRDRPAWDHLREQIIPRILEAKPADAPVRVWSAGCASGEEAYSLAILFAEAMGRDAFRERVKIYGTDVDEDALGTARQGQYDERHLAGLPEAYRERYFDRAGDDAYVFSKELRRSIIFGRHDLIEDAPISRIDLLAARNTLIYFNAPVQARILMRFHFALNDTGYLFLGRAETLLTRSDVFRPTNGFRIFSKVSDGAPRDGLLMLAQAEDLYVSAPAIADRTRLRDLLFESDPTAQFVVDDREIVVQANQQARDMAPPGQQLTGRALRDLPVSYRPADLRPLLDQARRERRSVALEDVFFPTPSGQDRWVNIEVRPLHGIADGDLLGFNIALRDITDVHELRIEVEQARNALEAANEELQSTNEELETTNEELQSTVEELETTNEELQSTNEELETMNAELQTTNDDLSAVNERLRDRESALNDANAFLASVIEGMHFGVIVVGHDMRVRAWSRRAEDLWGLRSEEVVGEPVLTLDIGFPVGELAQPLRACLVGNEGDQPFVVEAVNRRGRSIRCRFSCSPLRNAEGAIDGAIVLMEELA